LIYDPSFRMLILLDACIGPTMLAIETLEELMKLCTKSCAKAIASFILSTAAASYHALM